MVNGDDQDISLKVARSSIKDTADEYQQPQLTSSPRFTDREPPMNRNKRGWPVQRSQVSRVAGTRNNFDISLIADAEVRKPGAGNARGGKTSRRHIKRSPHELTSNPNKKN